MSAVFSTVLLTVPPAFLAGWVISKTLFRHLSVTQPNGVQPTAEVGAGKSVSAEPEPPAVEEVLAADTVRPGLEQLRTRLHAAQTEIQSLRTETQMLKEAAAERDHSIVDLKRKLRAKPVLPEPTAETVAAGETQKGKRLLSAMKDRLDTSEQHVAELERELGVAAAKSRLIAERFLRWREKMKPLAKQFRQQRFILGELREELRKRDAIQRAQDDRTAREQPDESGVADNSVAANGDSIATAAGQVAAGANANVPTSPNDPAQPFAQEMTEYGDDEREDLQVLRGIGPALHKKLNAHGIYRVRQLAVMDEAELTSLCGLLGLSHKSVGRHNWPQQARHLLAIPEQLEESAENVGAAVS
jgi:predicted flap endonuclease-1-like 5' DNA nuclease